MLFFLKLCNKWLCTFTDVEAGLLILFLRKKGANEDSNYMILCPILRTASPSNSRARIPDRDKSIVFPLLEVV